jgi:hypothetical protein
MSPARQIVFFRLEEDSRRIVGPVPHRFVNCIGYPEQVARESLTYRRRQVQG